MKPKHYDVEKDGKYFVRWKPLYDEDLGEVSGWLLRRVVMCCDAPLVLVDLYETSCPLCGRSYNGQAIALADPSSWHEGAS